MSEVGGSVEQRVALLERAEVEGQVGRVVRAHVHQRRGTRRVDLRVQFVLQQQERHEPTVRVLLLQVHVTHPVLRRRLGRWLVLGRQHLHLLQMKLGLREVEHILFLLHYYLYNTNSMKTGPIEDEDLFESEIMTEQH